MQLIYEGTNITGSVDVVSCVHRDVSGGRCDSLEIVLENADAWFRWKPQRDDVIKAERDGYSTGEMYLSAIRPEEGRYRIIATSVPAGMQRKMYTGYERMRLGDIAAACAAECGMRSALYGLREDLTYPFLLRNNEGPLAFLSHVLEREGAVLKALGGKLACIDVKYAQDLEALPTMKIPSDQSGAIYIKRNDTPLKRITVKTPYAYAIGEDSAVTRDAEMICTDLPATDNGTAGRWARGLLLMNNRRAEQFSIQTSFNPAMTAMTRMNVESAADFSGEWMIDEVTHDLKGGNSSIQMLRCIRTIG